jgi:hypothetical protein
MPLTFRTRHHGHEQSRLDLGDLRQLCRDGNLTLHHELQIEGTDLWFPAAELPGLWTAEVTPQLPSEEPRRWSGYFVVALFIVTSLATLSQDNLVVKRVKDFRMGILAGVGLYLIGEQLDRRRSTQNQSR